MKYLPQIIHQLLEFCKTWVRKPGLTRVFGYGFKNPSFTPSALVYFGVNSGYARWAHAISAGIWGSYKRTLDAYMQMYTDMY